MIKHRVSLEERSGIWLLFYESLISCKNIYEQQLLRIFKDFDRAENTALFVISDRHVKCPLIVRDNSEKDKMFRKDK